MEIDFQQEQTASASEIRAQIRALVANIAPLDQLEKTHIEHSLAWIDAGSPLFRVEKPDIPPQHLVSYFVVFDEKYKKVLLVDHKKAGLWLPPGGHVEPNEHPKKTVERECREELGISATFLREEPLFLTQALTVGSTAGHVDISFWYLILGSCQETYSYDQGEFHQIRWFDFNEIPFKQSDPHMKRFIQKLQLSL